MSNKISWLWQPQLLLSPSHVSQSIHWVSHDNKICPAIVQKLIQISVSLLPYLKAHHLSISANTEPAGPLSIFTPVLTLGACGAFRQDLQPASCNLAQDMISPLVLISNFLANQKKPYVSGQYLSIRTPLEFLKIWLQLLCSVTLPRFLWFRRSGWKCLQVKRPSGQLCKKWLDFWLNIWAEVSELTFGVESDLFGLQGKGLQCSKDDYTRLWILRVQSEVDQHSR